MRVFFILSTLLVVASAQPGINGTIVQLNVGCLSTPLAWFYPVQCYAPTDNSAPNQPCPVLGPENNTLPGTSSDACPCSANRVNNAAIFPPTCCCIKTVCPPNIRKQKVETASGNVKFNGEVALSAECPAPRSAVNYNKVAFGGNTVIGLPSGGAVVANITQATLTPSRIITVFAQFRPPR